MDLTPSQYYSERKIAKKKKKNKRILFFVAFLMLFALLSNLIITTMQRNKYADLLVEKEIVYAAQAEHMAKVEEENEILTVKVKDLSFKLSTLEELVVKLEDALMTLSEINAKTEE